MSCLACTRTPMHYGPAARRGSSIEADAVSGAEDNISSPIRVSPDRREPRVVKHSPRYQESSDDNRLSAKERLYVSKNAIGTCTCTIHVYRHTTCTSTCIGNTHTIKLGGGSCEVYLVSNVEGREKIERSLVVLCDH